MSVVATSGEWKSSAGLRASGPAAVVLICNENYVVPTFATALSTDHHTSAGSAAIFLFVLDAAESRIRQFNAAAAGTKIVVRSAALPQLEDATRYHRDRYLPPIALARLWIASLLPEKFDRLLYIDGDTMVDGDLDSLLALPPPSEGLVAAPDNISIFVDETSRNIHGEMHYLANLGCEPDSYFNSGVMYASRTAWIEICEVAKTFLIEHPELCRSSDQSALNFAARGRVTMLPLGYNFQSEHMMVFDPREAGFSPTIWHFTGGPKPWNEPGWPWPEEFNRFYRCAEDKLRDCDLRTPVPPEAQSEAGRAHRRRTRLRLRWVYPWRRRSRKRKIIQLLAPPVAPAAL